MSPSLETLAATAAASPGRTAVIVTVVAAASAVFVPHPVHANTKRVDAPVVLRDRGPAASVDWREVAPSGRNVYEPNAASR